MEERLTAVLEGRSPLEGDLEAVADELGGLVDNALAAASGLERAEDAADDLGDDLGEIQREASGAAAGLTAVAGAAETLDATASDVDLRDIDLSDVDLTFDTQNLDDILDSLERVPDQARTTRSALRALSESEALSAPDVDRDPALGFDPETVQQRYSVAVDRTDLRSGLGSIDDRTVRVNPVLSALQEQSQQIEADIDDLDISVGTSELSAAIAAVDTLEEHVDDLRSSLARLDDQRVSVTVDADVATAIADLELVESKLNDIDDRRATVDVAVDAESVATDIGAVTDTTAVDADADLDTDTDTATLSVPADVSGTDNVRALSATVDEAGDVATEAAEGLGTFGRLSERVRQQTDRLADQTARLRSLLGGDLGEYGGLRETADEADRLAERIDALPDRVSRTIRLDVTDDIPGFEDFEIGYRFGESDGADFSGRVRRRLSRSIDRISRPSLRLGRFLPDRGDISDVETPDISGFVFGEESTQIGVEFETDGVAAATDDAAEVAEGIDEASEAADVATDRLEQIEQQVKETTRRFEGLRAAMDVRDVIPDSLAPSGFDRSSLGFGADSADVESQLGDVSQVLRIGANIDIDDFETAAELADHLEANIDQLGDSATATVAELRQLGESAEGLVDDQVAAATTTDELADEVDDLGDESIESAAEVGALRSSMGALDDVGVNLGPFTTSLSRLLPLVAPLAAAVSALAASLGGLATAGAGAAGVLGGALYGGLQGIARELAATSTEAESVSDGMELLFDRIGTAAREALRPLERAEFQGLAIGAIEAGLSVISDFAVLVERVTPTIMQMADEIGGVFDAVRPEVFAELERTIVALAPAITAIATGALQALPGLLAFLRGETLDLYPALAAFTGALFDVLGPLTEIGTAILAVGLPALTSLLTILASAGNVIADTLVPPLVAFGGMLNDLVVALNPLLEGLGTAVGAFVAVAGTIAKVSGILASLSGIVSGGLIPTLYAMGAAVYAAFGPLGIAAGAIAAIITLLGGWGTVIKTVKGLWNGLVDVIEAGITGLYQGFVALVNQGREFLNTLIDIANAVPGISLDELPEAELQQEEADLSGLKVDASSSELIDDGGGDTGADASAYGTDQPVNLGPGSGTGTVMQNAVASLPSTSPTASSGGGGGSAATASTAGGSGTAARPTTGAAGMGGGTVNNYNYNVTVNATDLSRQEMKRVARQIHRKLERMDRKQTGPSAG